MLYNVKTIEYVDSVQVRLYGRPVKIENKIKLPTKKNILPEQNRERTEEQVKHSITSSVNRTVNQIYALSRSNQWDYFITLTFNPDLINNSDYKLISEKLNIWTNNLKKRYAPNLKYLFVPELHKDKSKWHFHGLFSDIGFMPLEFSGKVCVGKYVYDYVRKPYATKIFNLPLWKYGFSTATKVRDSGKASSYITKYITKDISRVLQNQHRFLSSQNVQRPIEKTYNIDYDSLQNFIQSHLSEVDYISNVNLTEASQKITYMEFNK